MPRNYGSVCLTVVLLLIVARSKMVSAAESAPVPKPIMVLPPLSMQWPSAFKELHRQGLKVAVFGAQIYAVRSIQWFEASVPPALRFKPMEGHALVDTLAATSGFDVFWSADKSRAVLQRAVADSEIQRLILDLSCGEPSVRRAAAWRAGWMQDARPVAPLVKAARDADAELSRQALVSLRRLGWDAVLLIDDSAIDLAAAELQLPNAQMRSTIASALGRLSGERVIALLEGALSDSNKGVRMQAATSLSFIGGARADTLLEKALNDADDDVRDEVMGALAFANADRAVDVFEWALKIANPSQRARIIKHLIQTNARGLQLAEKESSTLEGAARTQCQIHIAKKEGEKGVPKLALFAASKTSATREQVGWALPSIGGDAVLTLLEKLSVDPDHDVRESTTYAVGMIGGDRSYSAIEKMLTDPDNEVRDEAAYMLLTFDGPRACAALEKCLTGTDASLRTRAACRMKAHPLKAMPILKKMIVDTNVDVRRLACRKLGEIGGDAAVDILEKAVSDADESVRLDAITALGAAGGEKALGIIETALGDPVEKTCRTAYATLGNFGGERALELLESGLQSSHKKRRAVIVKTLANSYLVNDVHAFYKSDGAVALLEKALKDSELSVRKQVANALADIGTDRAMTRLENILADPDAVMRASAAEALGRIQYDRDLTLLQRALADVDANVRVSAAQALWRIPGARAQALEQKALADPDVGVRDMAVMGLSQTHSDAVCAILIAAAKIEPDKYLRRDMEEILKTAYADNSDAKAALASLKPLPEPELNGPPADEVLAEGLARAQKESKKIFLVFGSPTCGWCVRLEHYHADPVVKAILEKAYVLVDIDTSSMKGGIALYEKYAKGGAPSWAVLDTEKKVLINSDGYFSGGDNCANYTKVLKLTAPAITDEEIKTLIAKINQYGTVDDK